MARKRAVAKTSTINRTTPVSSSLLERYCRGLEGWPRAWMGIEKDLPMGEKLVACFRPFLEDLVAWELSPKSIQKHVDHVWAFGGEIIRDLNENPSLRRKPIEQILDDRIDDDCPRRIAIAYSYVVRFRRGLLNSGVPFHQPLQHFDPSLEGGSLSRLFGKLGNLRC